MGHSGWPFRFSRELHYIKTWHWDRLGIAEGHFVVPGYLTYPGFGVSSPNIFQSQDKMLTELDTICKFQKKFFHLLPLSLKTLLV